MGSFALALVVIMAMFAMAIYLAEANVRDRDLAERSAAVAKPFAVKLDKGGTYWIKAEDKVAFDDSRFKPGDEVSSIVIAPFTGDRGEDKFGGKWDMSPALAGNGIQAIGGGADLRSGRPSTISVCGSKHQTLLHADSAPSFRQTSRAETTRRADADHG